MQEKTDRWHGSVTACVGGPIGHRRINRYGHANRKQRDKKMWRRIWRGGKHTMFGSKVGSRLFDVLSIVEQQATSSHGKKRRRQRESYPGPLT